MTENQLISKALAGQVQRIRKESHKTQMQVLSDTNIHIGRIEMGKKSMSLLTLFKLCDYFQISTGEVIRLVESEIKSEIKQLSDEQ